MVGPGDFASLFRNVPITRIPSICTTEDFKELQKRVEDLESTVAAITLALSLKTTGGEKCSDQGLIPYSAVSAEASQNQPI